MAFSFGFAGDDIEADEGAAPVPAPPPVTTTNAGAFPVPGKPQLPARQHELSDLLAGLPSKMAYSCLAVQLDDGSTVQLPRRELWDVRVQLMAEDDGDAAASDAAEGLGKHDVKTGVYEGGFKSWESSVDLVKVLAADPSLSSRGGKPLRVIEVSLSPVAALHEG
jgi:protein-histidine N-methyltransferase